MTYIQHYNSPLGGILLAADEIGLTGLWFDRQKCFARDLSGERVEQETAAAPCRLCVPAVCLGNPFADSLWANHDLR